MTFSLFAVNIEYKTNLHKINGDKYTTRNKTTSASQLKSFGPRGILKSKIANDMLG